MFDFTWQKPQFGKALFRQEPEDFKVEEILGHELDGEGEFLFVYIEKRLQNTHWVADQLARLAGVQSRAVTYSGRKDRYAVTKQWFCLHIINKPTPEDWLDKEIIEGCTCLKLSRHRRKLRLGQHKKNIFEITLKDIQADKSSEIEAALARIKEQGVPNYFGEQRFGYQGSNMQTIADWMQNNKRPRGKTRQSMAISSLRSFFFNQMLAARQNKLALNEAIEGECFVLDGANSSFSWQERGDDWQQRLDSGDIHPSLALMGEGGSLVCLDAKSFEEAVIQATIDDYPALASSMKFFEQYRIKIARRAARVNVDNFTWQWHNERQLTCRFELVTGSFATAVLGELFELVDASKQEVEN